MGSDAIAAKLKQLLGIGFPRDGPRRFGNAGACLAPRPLRLRAVGDAGRRVIGRLDDESSMRSSPVRS
jgi:hypothetical protein